MALASTIYGIEYNPRQLEREPSGLGWILAIVAVVTLISLTVTMVRRYRADVSERKLAVEAAEVEVSAADSPAAAVPTNSPPVAAAAEKVMVLEAPRLDRRPAKLRSLLLRLEEAERKRNVEMAVSTIETIRAMPGSPAADLDDALAHRLGTLNIRRLMTLRSSEWVREVKVRTGQSAALIAAENGSTLASFRRLNGGTAGKLAVGSNVYVMDHPRFNLVVHCRQRCADLSLNGKFFKRYDLKSAPTVRRGAYEWSEVASRIDFKDRAELDMLLPRSASVLVSEL